MFAGATRLQYMTFKTVGVSLMVLPVCPVLTALMTAALKLEYSLIYLQPASAIADSVLRQGLEPDLGQVAFVYFLTSAAELILGAMFHEYAESRLPRRVYLGLRTAFGVACYMLAGLMLYLLLFRGAVYDGVACSLYGIAFLFGGYVNIT